MASETHSSFPDLNSETIEPNLQNLNWAAVLLGGFWPLFNKVPKYFLLFCPASLILGINQIIASAYGAPNVVGTLVIPIMAGSAQRVLIIFFAVHGNEILLARFKKRFNANFNPAQLRAVAGNRQQKLQILIGTIFRLIFYFATTMQLLLGSRRLFWSYAQSIILDVVMFGVLLTIHFQRSVRKKYDSTD